MLNISKDDLPVFVGIALTAITSIFEKASIENIELLAILIPYANRALLAAESVITNELKYSCIYNVGRHEYFAHNLTSAISRFEICLKYYKSTQNNDQTVKCLLSLG